MAIHDPSQDIGNRVARLLKVPDQWISFDLCFAKDSLVTVKCEYVATIPPERVDDLVDAIAIKRE